MIKYFDTVIATSTGRPLPGALVRIKDSNGDLATIYSDASATSLSNPVTTDSNGFFEFFIADGTYTLEFLYGGELIQTISDVEIFDSDFDDILVDNDNWSGTDLAVANGGTGASTAADARTNLGLGTAATATASALTKADDTNVTLTLGGTPATALLQATSLTLGWAGTLAVARGGTGASDAATARTNLGLSLFHAQEWTPNFADAGDVYIPADEAMTISQGNAAIGSGTLAYTKSTAAAPSTFGAATLPVTLEAGAWLKVTASAVTGFVATHLVRTA